MVSTQPQQSIWAQGIFALLKISLNCRLIHLLQQKINCETKAGQDHPEYEKFCEAYNLSNGNGTAGATTDPFLCILLLPE